MNDDRSTSAPRRSARPDRPRRSIRAALRRRLGRRDEAPAVIPSDLELRRRTVAAIEDDVHVRIAARRAATVRRDVA